MFDELIPAQFPQSVLQVFQTLQEELGSKYARFGQPKMLGFCKLSRVYTINRQYMLGFFNGSVKRFVVMDSQVVSKPNDDGIGHGLLVVKNEENGTQWSYKNTPTIEKRLCCVVGFI